MASLDDWYWVDTPPPPPPKVLMAVAAGSTLLKVRELDLRATIASPDTELFEKDFDKLLLCFNPYSPYAQVWVHRIIQYNCKPDVEVVWMDHT